jgi:Amidohydrolase family
VRVVGGWTEFQFVERRMPTLEEINAAAPDTPVFILHLYCRALLNRAALKACGYTKDSVNPPGGEIVRDKAGNPTGMLVARPNATILYAPLAKGPKLPPEYQYNSTRHFMRELNRLGVTSVCDAGGGYQNYPEEYKIIQELNQRGEMTIRIAYNLFTQKPGGGNPDCRVDPQSTGKDYRRSHESSDLSGHVAIRGLYRSRRGALYRCPVARFHSRRCGSSRGKGPGCGRAAGGLRSATARTWLVIDVTFRSGNVQYGGSSFFWSGFFWRSPGSRHSCLGL